MRSSDRAVKIRRISQAHLTISLHRWQFIIDKYLVGDSLESASDETIDAIYQEMGLPEIEKLMFPDPPAWRGGR